MSEMMITLFKGLNGQAQYSRPLERSDVHLNHAYAQAGVRVRAPRYALRGQGRFATA
jgi:hypothetical protein